MVDAAAVAGLKERYDNCDELLGSSHIVQLSVSNKPKKPLTLTITNPSGGSKKRKSERDKVATATLLPRTIKPFGLGSQGSLYAK